MNPIKRFFLSRTTTLCLIASALAAVVLSTFIPQSFLAFSDTMHAWRASHPRLGQITELLGLHDIYTNPVFLLILGGVTISLSLSTWNQCTAAWRLTFRPDLQTGAGDCFTVLLPKDTCSKIVAGRGYLPRKSNTGPISLVRNPWGYWGNSLLHAGMLISIAASLFIALTQQQAVIQLAEGVVQRPGDPLLIEQHGMLGKPLVLPEAIRLERVSYRFRPDYSMADLASSLSFLSERGTVTTRTVAINRIVVQRGIRVYQGVEFGHAFWVEATGPGGDTHVFQLQLEHPAAPGKPSYNDFPNLLGDGRIVRAKYVVNQEGLSFDRVEPLLTLRLDDADKEVGRLPLLSGEQGTIGPYVFRLASITSWSRLILVNLAGISCVFFGFFIICLGAALYYFVPPQEVVLREAADGATLVCWRATRFAPFYADESATLKKVLGVRPTDE